MKIIDVICSAGRTGFYFDDQRAIKAGAKADGAAYIGEPKTAGFTSVRQPGESISVMLILEDGQIATGDCAAVQYSGCGGRDPLFLAKDFIPIIEKYIKPQLIGREADNFRKLAADLEAITVDGKRLHTAIRYGLTQALLDAVAKSTRRMMCEVVADEYGCTIEEKPLDVFTQSGDDRYTNSDKMIIKGAQILPHALINNVKTKLGEHGELLLEYVTWLRNRVLQLRTSEDYNPIFHIDVYGTIGAAFGIDNYKAMAARSLTEPAGFPTSRKRQKQPEQRRKRNERYRKTPADPDRRNYRSVSRCDGRGAETSGRACQAAGQSRTAGRFVRTACRNHRAGEEYP